MTHHRLYRLALVLIALGAGLILCVQLDPLIGAGQILLTAGTILLTTWGKQ